MLHAATSVPTTEHQVPDPNWEMRLFFCDVATEVLNINWPVLLFQEVKVDGSL